MASTMQIFEGEDLEQLIRHLYGIQEFDKERITQLIELINDPKNLNIYIRSKSYESVSIQEDPWYKTKYLREPFNDDLLSVMT